MTTIDWTGHHPPEADEGMYKIGTMVMVSKDALGIKARNPDLPDWFPARVCLPPESSEGSTYRWYDPFVWFETEMDLWDSKEPGMPRNMFWNGNLWSEYFNTHPKSGPGPWIFPLDVWQEKFGNETLC